MAMWTIYRKLNVSPSASTLVIPIKQYSSDFTLKFQLYSTEGDLDIVAGATTKIRGTKRDGNGFELTGTRIGHTCTFSGTKAQMQQMTAAHGRCVFEVVVEHDGKELITANFYLEVQRAAMDAGTVTSESIIEEFADFQSKITAAQAAATAAQEQADRAEAAAESVGRPTDEQAQAAVNNWLNEHPEATTTVQDRSLTYKKLVNGTLNFVTPEMYGAKGDSVSDDSNAFKLASENGVVVCDKNKTYFFGSPCTITNSVVNLNAIVDNETAVIRIIGNNLCFSNCDFTNDEFFQGEGRGNWIVSVKNSSNVVIEECRFHEGVSAIYIDRCNDVKICGNTFDDFRQYGMEYGGNGYGILLIETENVTISNNIFKNVARHSVYISHDDTSTYNKNILITGNIFEWTSAVVGNTSGFELTLNIRPAKYVTISNNLFINMFGICGIATQEIIVDGMSKTACSEHILIKNNVGYFANHPRYSSTGVIYAPASENNSEVAPKDIIVSSNIFEIEKGCFACLNTVDTVYIKDNIIKYVAKTDSYIFSAPYPASGIILNKIVIEGNRFENAYAVFRVQSNAQNVKSLCIENNNIDVTGIGNCITGTTFEEFKLINNVITSVDSRAYFSSAAVQKLTLRGNTTNQKISLYLMAAEVESTDACFSGYGFNNVNPEGCIPGTIHAWQTGEVYIKGADNNWHLIS